MTIWVPGAPRSPNRQGRTTRARMRANAAERDKAILCARAVRNSTGAEPFPGPTRIQYELRRVRRLDHDNAWGSLKHIQDGIAAVFLPMGDGDPRYRFFLEQVPVARGADGVLITLTEG